MSTAFHKIPPEIWEKVLLSVERRDLAAVSLISRRIVSQANARLYSHLEFSLCKSSDRYYRNLTGTLSKSREYAALCTSLLIDMSITCPVEAISPSRAESVGLWRNRRPWKGRLAPVEAKMTMQEWNKLAVSTLRRTGGLDDVLPSLANLETITIILGTFDQDPTLPEWIFRTLPHEAFANVKQLKMKDLVVPSFISPIGSFTSLKVIDFAFVSFLNKHLWHILAANAESLEELRIQWVKESDDKALFEGCEGVSLRRLRVFEIHGGYTAMNVPALMELLGDCEELREFSLRSLSMPSARDWNKVIQHMMRDGRPSALAIMRKVNFGCVTGCTEFWSSVAQFLCRCGDRLESLTINGSSRGTRDAFPEVIIITQAFLSGMKDQPKLQKLTIVWRDDKGVDAQTIRALTGLCPSTEVFHLCLSYPLTDTLNTLIKLFRPLQKLRGLLLVFPTFLSDIDLSGSYTRLNKSIATNDTFLKDFWVGICRVLPVLEDVSWSTFEANVFLHPRLRRSGKASYVKITRKAGSSDMLKIEDQLKIYRDYESDKHCRFDGKIGDKSVRFGHRPGWREEMGNPLTENGSICDYPEIYEVGTAMGPPAGHHEL